MQQTSSSRQQTLIMRLFDKLSQYAGEIGALDIYRDHDQDNWKKHSLKVYHQDGWCWILTREQVYKGGEPSGYQYKFEELEPSVANLQKAGLARAGEIVEEELMTV